MHINKVDLLIKRLSNANIVLRCIGTKSFYHQSLYLNASLLIVKTLLIETKIELISPKSRISKSARGS